MKQVHVVPVLFEVHKDEDLGEVWIPKGLAEAAFADSDETPIDTKIGILAGRVILAGLKYRHKDSFGNHQELLKALDDYVLLIGENYDETPPPSL